METNALSEDPTRDLSLLTQIEADPDVSQASLASELGVAIGTINWHLKRMVAKGYVKVKRAQRKKLRYIITPEGIALRAALTMDYIRNSFDLYRHVRRKTGMAIEEARQHGFEALGIQGEGEIAEVCRLTCLEQEMPVSSAPNLPQIVIDGIKLALIMPSNSRPAAEERGMHGSDA